MHYAASPPPADIDRLVLDDAKPEAQGEPRRISSLVAADRWVLLGEPGSGKSTTFAQAAREAGTSTLTARAFLEGARPVGDTLFLDAIEEYRIGESGHDRLAQLAKAITDEGYTRWRLTCRSASLSAPDLRFLATTLGAFETWHLAPLDVSQQREILVALGEADPAKILRQVEDLAAVPLVGNPATLKLLHGTVSTAPGPIRSRGELFHHATRAMAEEINPNRPDRPDRSTPGAIVAAAEKACLVLILSARSELWMLGSRPPRPDMVERDDLLPARVDIKALLDAVDTAMFRGEAGSFSPTHRMVAEYLAGRALAKATQSLDGDPPALPYRRAYALLCGSDDKPAPALMGAFAWFVTTLAEGPHAARAAELVRRYPEAILFQGDASMLPTEHRRILLDATGGGDPWFMSNYQGATAIGGLAGEDLEPELRAILNDPSESVHRRAMVIEALTSGRRVPGLDPDLEAFGIEGANPGWLRRLAVDAIIARFPKPKLALRRVLAGTKAEPAATAASVRLAALAELAGVRIRTPEALTALKAYAGTGDGVMGYAWRFGQALEAHPPADFFDAPLGVDQLVGQSRTYEVRGIIERVLAAHISASRTATAEDILRWLKNAGFDEHDDPHDAVRAAIRAWTTGVGSPWALFWALYQQRHDRAWHAPTAYARLVGAEAPESVVLEVLKRLKAARPGPRALRLAWVAYNVMGPFDPDNALYWRLWHLLEGRVDLEPIFSQMTFVRMDHWSVEQNRERLKRQAATAAEIDRDRDWLTNNLELVRSGAAPGALHVAAFVYTGHTNKGSGGYGRKRLQSWINDGQIDAVTQGWTAAMANFPYSWRQQANQEATNTTYHANFMAAAWADDRLSRGLRLPGLSLDAAFAILRGYYALQGDRQDDVQHLAAARIAQDSAGRKAMVSYWKIVTKKKPGELPHAGAFEAVRQADWAVATFLADQPDVPVETLRSALALAARVMTADALLALVRKTLRKRSLSAEARSLWSFAGFLLDPEHYETAFEHDVKTIGVVSLLDRINRGHLIRGFDRLTGSTTARDRAIARHLGPHHEPNDNYTGSRDDMGQVIAGALKTLAATPTHEAGDALQELLSLEDMAAWHELLRHHIANQTVLLQEATFTAPDPKVVAWAILAGPPAKPTDLRAVLYEILQDLAEDIKRGDTSGWRGFWNNPGDADARRPKEENDCRDLLLDRIRDRLVRFGVKARHRLLPESRRGNDRRADMLMIGEGRWSLPIEVKRHLHKDIWTASADQLADYGRSPDSDGHGIYLVFWFGVNAGPVPTIPAGVCSIDTAEDLRRALVGCVPEDLRHHIDVVVIDVAPPPMDPTKAKRAAAKAAKAAKSKGEAPATARKAGSTKPSAQAAAKAGTKARSASKTKGVA